MGVFILADGSSKPARVHMRDPSFVNLQALRDMCVFARHNAVDTPALLPDGSRSVSGPAALHQRIADVSIHFAAGGLAALTAGSAGISSLRRQSEGTTDKA
jgi:hypothetical protein